MSKSFHYGDNRGGWDTKIYIKTQQKYHNLYKYYLSLKMKQKHNTKYSKKHLFKREGYCPNCQQKKSCGILDPEKNYCCSCYRKLLEELEWEQLLIEAAQQLLNDYRTRVIKCQCLESEKPRVKYLNSDGSGWNSCEKCEKVIEGAGHHGVVKNRNNPQFWGIETEFKILCLKCLEKKFYGKLSGEKRKTFNRYLKRGYV